LIERAQYRRNHQIYDSKANKLRSAYGAPLSFLEWMLIETERLHAKVRRYTSPEEHAFYPQFISQPILPELDYPQILKVDKNMININGEIMRWYVAKIIDRLCAHGDDEQYGSSVLCDITAMQAISRRIHYGKFVAESKYLTDPETYKDLIYKNDAIGILQLLTNVEVEKNVLKRAYLKASTYGRDITGTMEGYKVDPILIVDIYRDMIIPLTKDIEVRYLYLRHGIYPPAPETYFELCRGPQVNFDNITSI
jgi:chorismate mutase